MSPGPADCPSLPVTHWPPVHSPAAGGLMGIKEEFILQAEVPTRQVTMEGVSL